MLVVHLVLIGRNRLPLGTTNVFDVQLHAEMFTLGYLCDTDRWSESLQSFVDPFLKRTTAFVNGQKRTEAIAADSRALRLFNQGSPHQPKSIGVASPIAIRL